MSKKTLTCVLLTLISTTALAEDLSLEPCINGEVSSTGLFPTQEMEDQVFAYLDWKSKEPYYLFRIASDRPLTAYSEDWL